MAASVGDIVNARSYYHHLRTVTADAMLTRQTRRGIKKPSAVHTIAAARHAIDRLNRMLVNIWMQQRHTPRPQKVIRVAGIAYVLLWSNGQTHKYVPRTQYIPGSFRMVSPDYRARMLAELHTAEQVDEEMRRLDALNGAEPLDPTEIA